MSTSRIVACVALAAALSSCAGDDGPAAAPPTTTPPAWQTVFSGGALDRALLSAWGPSPDRLFAVGGSLGNGPKQALVLSWEGGVFRELDAPGDGSFWWVHGTSADDVWMVGEQGRVAHWDGHALAELPRPTTATLWGVFAVSKTEVWMVGGTPGKGTSAPNDLVFRWDGAAITPVDLPKKRGGTLFKVWATKAGEVFAVGEGGTVWHLRGDAWSLDEVPSKAPFRTVNGCDAADVWVVGGPDVVHWDGAVWSREDVSVAGTANGVACLGRGDVAVVGNGGLKLRKVAGAWLDERGLAPLSDLHSVYSDGAGVLWAAGGDFVSPVTQGASRSGVLGRFGPGVVAPTLR